MKVDVDGRRVTNIWFEGRTQDAGRRAALFAALRAIDALTPCGLVDHWLHVEGAVGDDGFMEDYMELLARQN